MIHCNARLDGNLHFTLCAKAMFLSLVLGVALPVIPSATASTVSVTNPGFDDVNGIAAQNNGGDWSLNNTFNFGNGSYNGWTVAAGGSGTGVINVDPGDMSVPTQATSGDIALLFSQTAFRSVRQTTSHVISPSDVSFTLAVDVGSGKSGTMDYEILLYGDDGLTRSYFASFAETVANASPGAWSNKVLVAAQPSFTSLLGQNIGIELRHTSGIELFVDSVSLTVAAVPEPASGLMACVLLSMAVIAKRGSNTRSTK